jgi:NTP pyrophosphatase (non-canonical NTP hydrolase)
MEFNDYQTWAKTTAVYPDRFKVIYPTLGLTGEAGEVAEKVKKYIRDGNDLPEEYDLYVKNLTKELGDVLWYISAIASDLDINLETVAQMNVAKLNSRKNRNEIGGSGDNR